MSEASKIKRALERAAGLLSPPGRWCQGTIRLYRGGPDSAQFCAVGALREVAPLDAVQAEIALRRHLGVRSVLAWNDNPARTQEDVVSAMLAAAAGLGKDAP